MRRHYLVEQIRGHIYPLPLHNTHYEAEHHHQQKDNCADSHVEPNSITTCRNHSLVDLIHFYISRLLLFFCNHIQFKNHRMMREATKLQA